MYPKPDPLGLNLLFEWVKGNRTAGGCVILLMEVVTSTIFARALWQVLNQTLPVEIATQWTVIVTLSVFGIYSIVRLIRFLKAPIYDRKNQFLPVTTFVFALLLGIFCALMLNGTFDSGNSSPPGDTFFLLFYGLPLGGLVIIGMCIVSYLQVRKWNGLMIISALISLPVLAVFLSWHFLALGFSGTYYPCLVDILALIMLVVLVVVFAMRNRQRVLEQSAPDDQSTN